LATDKDEGRAFAFSAKPTRFKISMAWASASWVICLKLLWVQWLHLKHVKMIKQVEKLKNHGHLFS